MLTRKVTSLVLVVLLVSGLSFGQSFEKAEYLRAKQGEKKGENIKGTLHFDSAKKEVHFLGKNKDAPEFTIKYDSIKSMLYEKAAKPRYAAGLLIAWPLLFTKSKKHYLTIHYNDAAGAGQFVLVKLDKSNFREALARAEAETGKKIERQEER